MLLLLWRNGPLAYWAAREGLFAVARDAPSAKDVEAADRLRAADTVETDWTSVLDPRPLRGHAGSIVAPNRAIGRAG